MKVQSLFRIALVIIILFLTFLIYRSIMRPGKFRTVYEQREDRIVECLEIIRNAQNIYKQETGKVAADIDVLYDFVQNGSITVEQTKLIREVPKNMSEEDAFAQGYLEKSVVKIPAKRRMFENDKNLDESALTNFNYIPETGNKFTIDTATVESAGVKIPVYRIYLTVDDILANMQQTITPENSSAITKFWNGLLYKGLEDESQYRAQYRDIWMGALDNASVSGSWESK